jgi:hypothetical protein
MTTTINASTSSGLVVTPDNSGNIVLQYNGVAAPAFSAWMTTSYSVTSGSWTKIPFDTEQYDTANAFSTSTYRFTPPVAGYYQINLGLYFSGSASVIRGIVGFYKNGTLFNLGAMAPPYTGVNNGVVTSSTLIYLNGSTDYLEFYGLVNGTSPFFNGDATTGQVWVNGCLLRGA